MKKHNIAYLIGVLMLLPILSSCEPDKKENEPPKPTTLDDGVNRWHTFDSQIDTPTTPTNATKPVEMLKTSVNGPSGPIDVAIKCNDHTIDVVIRTNQNKIETTPLYSATDGAWAHSFHVDFMKSTSYISERLPARRSTVEPSAYIISKVQTDKFGRVEGYLKFQISSRSVVKVLYDETLRSFAKACKRPS